MVKLLVTTTSFQDTKGKHQDLLLNQQYDITYKRGPLMEDELLGYIHEFDAILCGDDELTRKVLTKGKEGKLRVISKYGVGLDKIDLEAAKELEIPITNCPGVNQVSVAEHVFALILSFYRNIPQELDYVMKQKQWKRLTGSEMFGKSLLILGLGKIGKEIAKRALCFGLKVYAYDKFLDKEFCNENNISTVSDIHEVLPEIDILSLNLPLSEETQFIIGQAELELAKENLLIVNTARGRLVDVDAVIAALNEDRIAGYCTDVLDIEPMPANYNLSDTKNVFITPHIGSRTNESVERQGVMSVENLIQNVNKYLK